MRVGQFLVQTPLGTWLCLGIQPHYEAPTDLQVKIVENAVINIELVRLSPPEWGKVDHRTAK